MFSEEVEEAGRFNLLLFVGKMRLTTQFIFSSIGNSKRIKVGYSLAIPVEI